MIYRDKREKDGHDGFEVFFGKNEKKLVKTCLFQNKYLSLQRTLVVKGHWADIGQASNRLPTLQSLSLNLKQKPLGKGSAIIPYPRVSKNQIQTRAFVRKLMIIHGGATSEDFWSDSTIFG